MKRLRNLVPALALALALPAAGRAETPDTQKAAPPPAPAFVPASELKPVELPISIEDYKVYRRYQSALEDERVKKMAPDKRLPAIARNFKMKESALRDIVAEGEANAHKVGPLIEAGVRQAFVGADLASRIQRVRIDATAEFVIAYVAWSSDQPEKFDREACTVALRTSKVSPLIKSIKVEIPKPGGGPEDFLFHALVNATAVSRIEETKIPDYASSRYIRLFEVYGRTEL